MATEVTMPKLGLRLLDSFIITLALAMVLYHLIATQIYIFPADQHQAIHLGFALTLVFLSTLRTIKQRELWPVILVLILGGITVCSYVLARTDYLQMSAGFLRQPIDWVIGILLVIVVLEAARQSWGWILVAITIGFIIYFFYGHLLPEPFKHATFQTSYVISKLGLGLEGVFMFLGVSADYIFLFVVFGGLMGVLGMIGFFKEIGKPIGRVLAGGPAQLAVVSSATVGMVSGSAVTNVALTGSFTIPWMKRMGYKPEQAGAVEAVASSGGQVTPPIMGSVAFVMASLLGIPYVTICIAAIIPCMLYYLSAALGIQVMAYKNKISPLTEKMDWGEVIRIGPLFVVPIGVIIVLLLMRFSPPYAAFYAVLAAAIVPALRKETRIPLSKYVKGFVDGAIGGAKIAVAVALIGMLTQSILTTGLGVKIAYVVELLSGGQLWLSLIITALVLFFLGMGVPTLPAYMLVAIVVAPALVQMGVPVLAAHFFAFWYAVFALITPPVAMAAMAGAALARAKFSKTCWEAFRLGIAAFIVPLVLIFNPIILLQPQAPLEAALVLIATFSGLAALVATLHSWFFARTPPFEWLLWLLATVGLLAYTFTHAYFFFIGGMLLFIPLLFWQLRKRGNLRELGKLTYSEAKND